MSGIDEALAKLRQSQPPPQQSPSQQPLPQQSPSQQPPPQKEEKGTNSFFLPQNFAFPSLQQEGQPNQGFSIEGENYSDVNPDTLSQGDNTPHSTSRETSIGNGGGDFDSVEQAAQALHGQSFYSRSIVPVRQHEPMQFATPTNLQTRFHIGDESGYVAGTAGSSFLVPKGSQKLTGLQVPFVQEQMYGPSVEYTSSSPFAPSPQKQAAPSERLSQTGPSMRPQVPFVQGQMHVPSEYVPSPAQGMMRNPPQKQVVSSVRTEVPATRQSGGPSSEYTTSSALSMRTLPHRQGVSGMQALPVASEQVAKSSAVAAQKLVPQQAMVQKPSTAAAVSEISVENAASLAGKLIMLDFFVSHGYQGQDVFGGVGQYLASVKKAFSTFYGDKIGSKNPVSALKPLVTAQNSSAVDAIAQMVKLNLAKNPSLGRKISELAVSHVVIDLDTSLKTLNFRENKCYAERDNADRIFLKEGMYTFGTNSNCDILLPDSDFLSRVACTVSIIPDYGVVVINALGDMTTISVKNKQGLIICDPQFIVVHVSKIPQHGIEFVIYKDVASFRLFRE